LSIKVIHNVLNLPSYIMLLFGLLFLSGVSAQTEGCIKEEYTDYNSRDIVEQETLENPQACAEHCASTEGGLFWTFSLNSKTCHVKNSTHNSRRGIMYTVSGNRACGLSTMGGTQNGYLTLPGRLVPIKVVVSQEENDFPPHQCADSDNSTFCGVAPSPAPWLALDLGSKARVDRVEIRNRVGENRLRDFEIRVTDSLPPSGEEMFREGVLMGSYVGLSVNWQKITIQSPASGPTTEGRYVLLQMDNNQTMEVYEIVAFGGHVVELEPVTATLSSLHGAYVAGNCIDGNTVPVASGQPPRICHTENDTTPWIAIDYGTRVIVERVEIFNRVAYGDRTRNVDVRISDELPTSGDQMFSGGTLLGQFAGPGTDGQRIIISGQETSGRYVIVQMNSPTYLNLQEVKAFGRALTGELESGAGVNWKLAPIALLAATLLSLLF
jgi:hypothetical protein